MSESSGSSIKKKLLIVVLAAVCAFGMFAVAGCSGGSSSNDSGTMSGAISVVSREDGSGTRGAFTELLGIQDADGNDATTSSAIITNSTSVALTTVAGDEQAIGYISLGSLDDTVKAVSIDGVEPSVDTVKDGSYTVARPFNIVTTSAELTPAAQDFLNYILSSDGQQVIEDNGYVAAVDNASAYSADSSASGTVVVAGSSSVTPVMEKLAEAYQQVNTNVTVEVQQSDSSTGVQNAIDGVCDLGMASRDLKDSETSAGAQSTVIAMDGIAVIVNNNNPTTNLTSEQVKGIYTGEITDWSEIQ
ncbi:MAG: substrate-binding domain-containing protein [Coriobacteriales bacterium]|jgi:phosphate transport system substrate-binding protein